MGVKDAREGALEGQMVAVRADRKGNILIAHKI